MRIGSIALFALFASAPAVYADTPAIPEIDRIRIAEAFRLAEAIGNQVWPDWDKAPFAVLLITNEHEFLIRHPKPSDDFTSIGEDTLLKSKVWYRKRMFDTHLQATFPAVGGVSTIVMGQAENTASKTSTRWVITLLHEHFHQLQNSQPRYFANVDSLGLARGDMTGMWMLNYAFPYTTLEVKDEFAAMSKLLVDVLKAKPQADFDKKLTSYLGARKKFQSLLKSDDYKYFAFQVWQEGIARYTEYRVADLAAAKYEPTKEFAKLKDYTTFKDEAKAILERVEKELASMQLDKAKRTAFYPLGAAEGLVLDRAKPDWQKHYFQEPFSLDVQFRPEK
jgi:hypothetical protein